MKITSTKGNIEIASADHARAWFDEFQPSYADIDGVEVAARFDDDRQYWLSDGDTSIDLGWCQDVGVLAWAVANTILAGDADWSGWEVTKA